MPSARKSSHPYSDNIPHYYSIGIAEVFPKSFRPDGVLQGAPQHRTSTFIVFIVVFRRKVCMLLP
jgi:hypothetical protein